MNNIFYPIELFSDWFVYTLLNLEQNIHFSEMLHFFIYDTLKILILLIFIVHLMSLVRHYLPIQKFRLFLLQHKLYGLDYFLASGFGAITPFCSCSSIPLFIGFLQAGIPVGVTFSFLITSPLINEIAVALFVGLFGWKITIYYIVAGMFVGMMGGFVLQKLKMEKYIISLEKKKTGCCCKKKETTPKQIATKITKEAFHIVKNVFLYIIIGVGIGAIIHGYVPENFFEMYLQKTGFFSVPLAVILAVPLYSNASGVIPIIQSLIAKGVPIGTGIAFMMAVVGLSFPEAMILKKVLKWQLLSAFFGIVTIGIILIGYLFNIIL
jgi:uncharacterized protein